MPRASKRKATLSDSVTSDVDYVRSASGKAIAKEVERIERLFDTYSNKSLGMIDPEGIEALCKDLGVDHTDVRILMLAWKMKAQKQGYFAPDEWRRGLKDLRADTLNKLKKALSAVEKEVKTPHNFEDFYSYAYRYCLTEDKQKSVDIETVCELLNLVLGYQFRHQVDLIIEYLKIQTDYRAINMDKFSSLLQ